MIARATTLRRMTSQAPSEPEAVPADLHTTAGKIADLQRRRDEAMHAGSERAVERQQQCRAQSGRGWVGDDRI